MAITAHKIITGKLILLGMLLLLNVIATAQQPIINRCPNNAKATDEMLESAVQAVVAGNQSVSFIAENNPCSYSRGIKSNLNATINKNYFNLAKSHYFSLIKSDAGFFSIEHFVFKTENQANSISQILANRSNNQLKTEGVTFYDYFQIHNQLIFYLADRRVYQQNLSFFQNLKGEILKNPKN